MTKNPLLFCAFLSVAALAELPMPPKNRWPVSMIESRQHLYPTLAPFRTSNDGRVGLNHSPTKKGETAFLLFHLFVPEKLTQPFLESSPGNSVKRPYAFARDTEMARFHGSSVPGEVIFQTLCDGTVSQVGKTFQPGERKNPYRCGPRGESDCYDLTVVSAYGEGFGGGGNYADAVEFWGTDITVTVANPKTSDAGIVSIVAGKKTRGARFPGVKAFFEPMVTEEGRLLVGRIAHSNFSWKNNRTGLSQSGIYEIMYSYNRSQNPCDVRGWDRLAPASHLFYDPELKDAAGNPRYEVARYPFRDSEGFAIPDGEDLGGTYPWIDRKGRNLFYETISSTLYTDTGGVPTTRYPAEPHQATSPFVNAQRTENVVEQASNTRGISVIGGWTHGKLVLLDSILNNTDYGLGAGDGDARWLKLYASPNAASCLTSPGNPACVKVAAGRETSAGDTPPDGVSNINIIESMENLFNHYPAFRPSTPRDVVWLMNTGRGSAEVAFDDYMDPHVFIYSDMTASVKRVAKWSAHYQANIPEHDHQDGWSETSRSFSRQVRLQNAATTTDWNPPMVGLVEGPGRVEPVALGGFYGKGYWLRTSSRLNYFIYSQPQSINRVWVTGLFFDSREPVGSKRVAQMLTFPDGSAIQMVGRSKLEILGPNRKVLRSYALPSEYQNNADYGWAHFGFRIANTQGTRFTFYFNGLPYDTIWDYAGGGGGSDPKRIFRLIPGSLFVGASPAGAALREGLYGWIDEFKVIANDLDPETFCNHAGGTLTSPSRNAAWADRVCTHNYVKAGYQGHFLPSSVHRVANAERTSGILGLRARVQQGPNHALIWNAPRPDFSEEMFCTSCHTPTHRGPLGTAALAFTSTAHMFEDRRRQPVHPFGVMFGNFPTGPEAPADPQIDPANGGLLLDPIHFPD